MSLTTGSRLMYQQQSQEYKIQQDITGIIQAASEFKRFVCEKHISPQKLLQDNTDVILPEYCKRVAYAVNENGEPLTEHQEISDRITRLETSLISFIGIWSGNNNEIVTEVKNRTGGALCIRPDEIDSFGWITGKLVIANVFSGKDSNRKTVLLFG